MLKRLNPNQEEKLREKYHDHPLFLTCKKAFHHYMASMEQFIFSEEKMFVEVVSMIDEIFTDPQNAGAYIDSHWDDLKIRLKVSVQPTPPQGDLEIVCGILYYIVAATFSLHWNSFYNTEIVGLLRDRVLELFREQREQETIIENLCTYAQGLDEWINDYEDSGVWLSIEMSESIMDSNEIAGNDKQRNNDNDEQNINIFDSRLNQDEIIKALKRINTNGLGKINVAYAFHACFEEINWLSDRMDTKFVSWMKANNLFTLKAKDLKQANPDDSRVRNLISRTREEFQKEHPKTGKPIDQRIYYRSGQKLINDGL